MAKQCRLPLKIGDWVLVNAVSEMQYTERSDRIVTKRATKPFFAQITGIARRCEGHYNRGSTYGYSLGDDFEEASLSITGTVEFWLVRAGLVNKQLEVSEDDLSVAENPPAVLLRRATRVPVYLEPAA